MQDIQTQGVVVGDRQVEVGGVMGIAFIVFVFHIQAVAEGIGLHFYLIGFWGVFAAHDEQEKQRDGDE